MKILSLTAVLAAALLGLASCNKQYDVEVTESNTSNNNGGSGGGGFNWTGTEPMSAKVDGTSWLAETATMQIASGKIIIMGLSGTATGINIIIPETTKEGQVFSMPNPAGMFYLDPIGNLSLMANPGKVKIVKNNADILEGYFEGTAKDPSGLKPNVMKITEGYFKVSKP